MFLNKIASLIVSLTLTTAVLASDTQNQEYIRLAITDFAQQHIDQTLTTNQNAKIKIGNLGSRLTLHACAIPLQVSTQDGTFTNTTSLVSVTCSDEQPWSIYVPLRISIYEKVVVLNRPLSRGDLITQDDIALEERDVSRIQKGIYYAYEEVIGKKIKQSQQKGSILSSQNTEPAILVKRGETIQILAENEGLRVQMTGTALRDGRLGEQIAVKNKSSERIIDAYVSGSGQVRTSL